MSRYVVIDTNVLVSALLSERDDDPTVQILAGVLVGEITLLYSNEIMKEYREVLQRQKFGFDLETVNYFLSAIEKIGILVDPPALDCVFSDMKDLPFYELMMHMRKAGAYLVTGNIKHFPMSDFIVTPRQMLDSIRNDSE